MTDESLPLYTFHLNALEIGYLIGAMSREKLPIRKELFKEVDAQIYSSRKKAKA